MLRLWLRSIFTRMYGIVSTTTRLNHSPIYLVIIVWSFNKFWMRTNTIEIFSNTKIVTCLCIIYSLSSCAVDILPKLFRKCLLSVPLHGAKRRHCNRAACHGVRRNQDTWVPYRKGENPEGGLIFVSALRQDLMVPLLTIKSTGWVPIPISMHRLSALMLVSMSARLTYESWHENMDPAMRWAECLNASGYS